MNELRKGFALASIIIGAVAIGIPDPIISKFCIALATGLNAASLYLLKEESDPFAASASKEN